jgi:D-alanyl-D-alanine carboxypeptidase (penicillin-binding protein 5/6)
MAEGLAGSEELFAAAMTEEGQRIGMKDSVFKTATGLPAEGQHVTVYDLAVLARDTIMKYPEFYEIYSELNFTYNGIKQGNRNPLLYKNIGVDGLKTGHTEASGYGLTASAERNGRRLIVAFNGTGSMNDRSSVGEALLGYGFLNFDNYHVFDAGESIGDMNVWLGTKPSVPMIIQDDLTMVLKRSERANMKVTAEYDEPISAPVREGDRIGTVHVTFKDREGMDIPILAGDSVNGLGPLQKVGAAIQYLIFGASNPASGDAAE